MYVPIPVKSEGVFFSMMKNMGIKYIHPMMFCVSVTVKGLYSNDSFRKEIEYATATITANKRKIMPTGDDVNCKFLFINMTTTPMNEQTKPMMFSVERCSLRKNLAAIGVNRGMVAIKVELMIGEAYSRP